MAYLLPPYDKDTLMLARLFVQQQRRQALRDVLDSLIRECEEQEEERGFLLWDWTLKVEKRTKEKGDG